MTKAQLIKEIQNGQGISSSLTEINRILDRLSEVIPDVLSRNPFDSIQLPGICTFRLKQRGARQHINPRTGEKLPETPAHKVVKVRIAKQLAWMVRGV